MTRIYSKKPWLPALAVTGWLVWAYLHLRPSAVVTSVPGSSLAYHRWAYGHLAYSDTLALYYNFHLANHALPYVQTRVEYPVLTGLFMWLAALAPGVQGYFLVSSLGLCACALGTTFLLCRIDQRFAWGFAFCPLLLVFGLLNWDLLAIFFMVAGWERFRAQRYGFAGVLLSLAVWAKFFPIVLLFYCVASLLGDSRHRVHARRMGLWAGSVALIVNGPFAVANFPNWSHFFVFNARRKGGGGVLYELHIASALPMPVVDGLTGALVVVVALLLVPRVLRGGSPIVAAAIAFAFLMLVNKVYSPQYMMWLFVFGLMAEWPVWSLALMSVAGLVDYVAAMTVLYLSNVHSPAFPWFVETAYPWHRVLRNIAIALGLVGAVAMTPLMRHSPLLIAENLISTGGEPVASMRGAGGNPCVIGEDGM